MAELPSHQRATFPLPAYNYQVTVDGESTAFSEVSGIAIEYDNATYRHGYSFSEGEQITTYHVAKHVPVTFKHGTVLDRTSMHQWLRSRQPRMVEVSLCDEQGQPVVAWRLARAVPTKLQAPIFDAATNEVSIETLEVLAAGITLVHH